MCGIFGLIEKDKNNYSGKLFRSLCLLSESRGKEASGFAVKVNDSIKVFKTPYAASEMVKEAVFKNEILTYDISTTSPFIGIGHSRLVTNGYEQYDVNNQPVVKDGFVVIHNGIIVNQAELWQVYSSKRKISDLDSELIPTIISHYLQLNEDISIALCALFSEIYGMSNIGLLSDKYQNLLLATNNGSIYFVDDLSNGFFAFASERFIIETFINKNKLDRPVEAIQQLIPGCLLSINLRKFTCQISHIGETIKNIEFQNNPVRINLLKQKNTGHKIYINTSLEHNDIVIPEKFTAVYNARCELIAKLKRCSKCILPETFPFISFDDKGVCNYCNSYQKHHVIGVDALREVAENQRKRAGRPECLVPFSGGRDSSFALHYVVKELGLKPIAFSYDWGMLTDLARRNQARMCGKLGVEHILISAEIRKKRENIRKNVLAWLKKPSLGTIPLFMAGDKKYFYFANILMKQNDLKLSFLGENLLETTNFKSGFCGIKPNFNLKHTYSLSLVNKLKMAAFYGNQFLRNTAYINSSLIDTLDAFKSYYIIKHNNLNIYEYLKWDENVITKVLIDEYNWEKDPGTLTTWRIGDGTASFYNYIYYMLAGFNENDTFRSNQIREGDITRDQALELSLSENQPRWESIQWYCRTIGVDFERTISIINLSSTLF